MTHQPEHCDEMHPLPDPDSLPALDTLDSEQRDEMAASYLDLIRHMVNSLHACETEVAFFRWTGHGFHITGHPDDDVLAALREEAWDQGVDATFAFASAFDAANLAAVKRTNPYSLNVGGE